jgi:2-polyprenyl-6-methoxyphenol hydroxylase-like FAD-dependent oxidoreductase
VNDHELVREATPAERERQERRAAVVVETSAMATAFTALLPLDRPARKRALRWLTEALENVEPPF